MHMRNAFLSLAALAIVAGGTATACTAGTGSDSKQPHGSVAASKQPSKDGSTDQQDGATTITVALGSTVKWNDGVTAKLSGFARGVSNEYAAPSGKPDLAFSVTMYNGSKNVLDLSMVTVNCPKGADEVMDIDHGLSGSPSTHLLSGQVGSWKTACVFPASETSAQIEVTPGTTGLDQYRTAIFTGDVK